MSTCSHQHRTTLERKTFGLDDNMCQPERCSARTCAAFLWVTYWATGGVDMSRMNDTDAARYRRLERDEAAAFARGVV